MAMSVKMIRERLSNHGDKLYQCPEDMEELILEYFDSCLGKEMYTEEGNLVLNKWGEPVVVGMNPPTISGLAFALGMTTRAVRDYQKDDGFKPLLDAAKQYIEMNVEQRLFFRDSARGAEFSLINNFGWKSEKDKSGVDGSQIVQFVDLPGPSEMVIDQQSDEGVKLEDIERIAAGLIESDLVDDN